ncbi:hypothetical protein GL286_17900 [Paracoccus aestuariivivens]|uniref:Plasmid replication protein C N-terminal domain-containing protein n=2 Tax=Paracoccus aestuariivivens TaxID=1820333 RepID=A0A6L6JI83_9RHOB|nr:hypothetical protein [Paracoccus aestuariivivens]
MKHMTAAYITPETGDLLLGRPRPGSFVIDRWEMLQLVKDTSTQTGIGEREIAILAAHLSVLTPGPIRADQLLVSYAQVSGMLNRANCMDERRFRRGEAQLEKLGFIYRNLSGNGRRFPVRDASGRAIDAYGIDLRPLFLRHQELCDLREQAKQDRCRTAALRSRISARLSAIKRQAMEEKTYLATDLAAVLNEIRNVLRRVSSKTTDLLRAEEKLLKITTYREAVQEDAIEPAAVPPSLPDKSTVDDGQSNRHSDSKRKEIYLLSRMGRTNERCSTNHHRTKPWRAYTEVASLYPVEPRTMTDILKIIEEFSGFVGVRRLTVIELIETTDPMLLLESLNQLARNLTKVRNPTGYLLSRVRVTNV